MTDTDRDAVERLEYTCKPYKNIDGKVIAVDVDDYLHLEKRLRQAIAAKEAVEAKLRHIKKEVVDTLEANEADALARAEAAEVLEREAVMQSLAHLGQAEEAWEAQKKAEAEAAALREKLRAKIKHLHAQLPYFNVPHIREGLEDMLDVIEKDKTNE